MQASKLLSTLELVTRLKLVKLVLFCAGLSLLCQLPFVIQPVQAAELSARDYILKGNYFLSRNQFKEAISQYESALKAEPNNPTAKRNILVTHNNWGIFYASQHKNEEAAAEWEAALKIDPSFKDARRNVLTMHVNQEKLNALQAGAGSGASTDVPITVWDPEADSAKVIKDKTAPAHQTDSSANSAGKSDAKKSATSTTTSAVLLTPGLQVKNNNSSYDTGYATNTDSPRASSTAVKSTASDSTRFNTANSNSMASTIQSANGITTNEISTNNIQANKLEEQLAIIELKVYGHKQTDLPILKRVEKLEVDTSGAASNGTIKERIDRLRQSWGL